MALEDYNVEKSKELCSKIRSELGVDCSYGYCDLGEYILFPEQDTDLVTKYLRSHFMAIVEVVGVEKSRTVLLVR